MTVHLSLYEHLQTVTSVERSDGPQLQDN